MSVSVRQCGVGSVNLDLSPRSNFAEVASLAGIGSQRWGGIVSGEDFFRSFTSCYEVMQVLCH